MIGHKMALIEIKKKTDSTFDKELLEKYLRLREDFLWTIANKDKLRTKYAKKYVAVENKKVKYASTTIEGIMSKILRANRKVEDFAIEYVGEHPTNLLF